jgi:hypothetical protein
MIRPVQPVLDHCLTCDSRACFSEVLGLDGGNLVACDENKSFCFLPWANAEHARHLAQVGGFGLWQTMPSVRIPPLPQIIPSVNGEDVRHLQGLDKPIAISYADLPGLTTGNPTSVRAWSRKHGLGNFPAVLIHGAARDGFLEDLYGASMSHSFWDCLREVPNAIFISPDFSIYRNGVQCRWEQCFNLSRRVSFGSQAASMGLPCIVSLGWLVDRDLRRFADWLNTQKANVEHISINSQTGCTATISGRSLMSENAAAVAFLQQHLLNPVTTMVFGPGSRRAFSSFYKRCPASNLIFVTKKAALDARGDCRSDLSVYRERLQLRLEVLEEQRQLAAA